MAIAALKPLERRLRRLSLGRERPFSGRLIDRPEDGLDLGTAPRILFVRAERIGDVLVSVPVLRAVRQRYSGATLDLLVSSANAGVAPAVRGWIDRVWRYDKRLAPTVRLVRQLRLANYDLMVDLAGGPSVTSRFVAHWSGAERVLGMLHEQPGFLTHAVPMLDPRRVHVVTRTAQLLLAFGVDPATVNLTLEYPLTDRERAGARARLPKLTHPYRFGVNVSGRGPAKYWGRDNFVEAIRLLRLLDDRFTVLVCGAPDAREEVAAIAAAAGADALAPLSSFHEFAAVINSCDLLLTPDTSVVHLAAAWRVPTVGLFRAEENTVPWVPYQSPHRAIVHDGPISGVSLQQVGQALAELIATYFGPGAISRPRSVEAEFS